MVSPKLRMRTYLEEKGRAASHCGIKSGEAILVELTLLRIAKGRIVGLRRIQLIAETSKTPLRIPINKYRR